jgi:hypothetical protein
MENQVQTQKLMSMNQWSEILKNSNEETLIKLLKLIYIYNQIELEKRETIIKNEFNIKGISL